MSQPRTFSLDGFLFDWATDEDSKPKFIHKATRAFRVLSAELNSSAAVAAADTNYNTFTLQKGTTAVATLANGPVSGGVDIAAATGAGGSMTLSSTLASLEFADGDVMNLKSVKTGSGQAVADMGYHIECEYID